MSWLRSSTSVNHPSHAMEAGAPPSFGTLKQILRHVRNPELLDNHPWTRGLIVQEALASTPRLREASPGQQLISALAGLFPQLQPANPPRCGKRLDPRWGEFGLLAALYFAPFGNGKSFPTTLVDAWGRIDPSILYFVYGKPAEVLTDEEVKKFELVGPEVEYAPASTLSDWHKKGLQRFTEIILNRERFLARTSAQPSVILEPERAASTEGSGAKSFSRSLKWKRVVWLSFALLLVTALGLSGLKGWMIYEKARPVYQDATNLQQLVDGPIEPALLNKALPLLKTLRRDLSALKQETQPLLWLSPRLGWVPTYGGDLESAPALLALAEHGLNASILVSEAAQPLVEEFDSQSSSLDPEGLTALLVQAQPQLKKAQEELDEALTARNTIQVARLSPALQGIIIEQLDPVLKLGNEGLSLAAAFPGILGAGSEGPKTYMLLPQNEDELRPTGGFITSVGNLVLHNGQIMSMEFESVDTEQEDWSKPYPAAPWQLKEYMNSRVLILRDANWFTDFPTTAMWVEYLYVYTHSHSVDGIIAFDQHFLVMLLGALGPQEVEGAEGLITDENVIEYMRQAKAPPSREAMLAGWYRKEFISHLAHALVDDLMNRQDHNWRSIARTFFQALEERHLLVQFDDAVVTDLLAQHGWDNAVRPEGGDFLMVTDSNIGFNKTNAVVDASLTYDVDLSDPYEPAGTLTVNHRNNTERNVPCEHGEAGEISGNEWYPIDGCYWTYLRVYKQAGVELVDATPHAVPGRWMLLGQDVPARVDELDEELEGVHGFGTLLVVPGSRSISTSFQFALPQMVLSTRGDAKHLTYHLKVQKQPGTLAVPLTVRIHLPSHATLESTSMPAVVQDQHILVETDLRTDVELEVLFAIP